MRYRIEHLPLDEVYVTSYFGPRRYKNMLWHNGVDFRAPVGKPVYAVADGTVKVAKANAGDINTGYGLYVAIQHEGLGSLYGHLSKYIVEPEQKVKAGDIIGYSGNSGDSEAPHLHFEIRLGEYEDFWTRCPSDANIFMYCINPWPLIENVIKRQNMTSEHAMILVDKLAGDLSDNTMDYMANDYRFGQDLIMKLAKAMI